ncbi:hypothetical protein, partial [Escherichia coli]
PSYTKSVSWQHYPAIAAIGFLLALFIGLRSRKETWHHSLKENVAPGG